MTDDAPDTAADPAPDPSVVAATDALVTVPGVDPDKARAALPDPGHLLEGTGANDGLMAILSISAAPDDLAEFDGFLIQGGDAPLAECLEHQGCAEEMIFLEVFSMFLQCLVGERESNTVVPERLGRSFKRISSWLCLFE